MNSGISLLILLGFFAVMYFVMIRPQRKKQAEHEEMVENLGVGDDVVTIGGLHGSIVALDDETVDLEVTDEIVVRYQRSSVAEVVGEPSGAPAGEDGES